MLKARPDQGARGSLSLLTLVLVIVAAVSLGRPSEARADSAVYCDVNGTGGFVLCTTNQCTYQEVAKAYHASGLPYTFRLAKHSTNEQLGAWTWNNLDYHVVGIGYTLVMRASVDNLGSGSPSRYYVGLSSAGNTCV